jgi:hypothetical protein
LPKKLKCLWQRKYAVDNPSVTYLAAKSALVLTLRVVKNDGMLFQESLEPLTDAIQFRKDFFKPRCWEPNIAGNPVTSVAQFW